MGVIRDIKTDLEQSALRLMREYYARLYADALKLCNDPTFSEDLVMQTINEVCRDTKGFDEDKGDFYSWMHGILVHLHAHAKRRLVTRGTTPVDPEELALNESLATNETDEQILKNSDDDALRKAVNRLPPAYRQAVVMHYFSEMPIKDIAILVKVPIGTIFWRLNIARKMLAKDLSAKLGKKKPLAVLFAVLLGVGTLFGAWQAVEAIFTTPAPTPTTTPTPTPTPTSTPTATDPTAPVMTYPTFSSESTASAEPVSTKQKESTMTTIKKTLLAAVSAVSLASTANAVDVEAVKTRVMPAGITATTMNGDNGFTYEYKKDGVKYGVAAFVADGTLDLSEIKALGVTSIDYLIVAGGGSGGCGKYGGGGGAGGMTNDSVSVTGATALTIKVGVGGASSTVANTGANGENSSIAFGDGVLVNEAYGGGGGGSYKSTDECYPAADGGSGGGANGSDITSRYIGLGGKGTPGQGNAGGGRNAKSNKKCGSGGGGAGGEGRKATTDLASDGGGGAGRACEITGMTVYYAGGGGGGDFYVASGAFGGGEKNGYEYTDNDPSICGGRGGGKSNAATNGLDGLGGGGGGAGDSKKCGAGGSGIVVIRWVIPAVRSQVTVDTTSGTGTGSVSGAGEHAEDEMVTLVATADEDSRFVEWSWDATKLDAKADGETLTFTMIAEPVEITAKFDKKLATGVTVAFEGGNYGTPDPAYGTYAEYADGTERTYTMAETVIGEGGEKIYLVGWKLQDGEGELVRDSDTGLGPDESISLVKFTCGTDEARTLFWRWEPRYTLTATANPAEGGTITGAGDYAAGSEVTLTANVTGGYKLTGWTGAPEDAMGVENTLTFAMPAAPTTVTANFEMVPWGITVVSGETTEDHRDLCEQGTPYQFQSPLYAEIKEGDSRKHCLGYTLTPMREGGEESELKVAELEDETLTATVTYAEPVMLTWKWVDDYYFTLAQDGEGTVTGPAEDWYASGTEFTLTATPAKNYEFLCWMGSVSGTDTTISRTITKPTSVKAFFSPVQQVKSDWEAIEGKPAKMRTVKSLGKTYCVVVFTNSTSTFDIPKKVTSIDCLVVGGGGGGGARRGGGGGAGGFNYQTGLAVTPGETLNVTVGEGGLGGTSAGAKGKDTTLKFGGQTITAQGGGFGGYDAGKPGEGASGGGVPGSANTTRPEMMGGASIAKAPEQGNPGGSRPTATSGQKCGAGGGGAGGMGGDVGNGKGGEGLPSTITGETFWYAAGGAGGDTREACEGAANTGNGGGGGLTGAGYAGGSGVVIIRYALPSNGVAIMIY